jgi:hypothetical protein
MGYARACRAVQAVGVALLLGTFADETCLSAPREDCAVSALTALLTVLRGVPEPPRTPQALGFVGQPPYSLLDIKRAAAGQGLALEGRECTWDEVVASRVPVVLALKDPDHFLVLLNQDGRSLQVADAGALALAEEERLRARFRGVALFPAPPEDGGPQVAVEEAHYEGGVVGVGQRIVHSFALRNAGAKPLTLAAPSATCCGLMVALDRQEVPAGEAATVVVGVEVTSMGPLLRAVRVTTNDPGRRCVYLTVGAHTAPGVRISPERLTLVCDNFPGGRDRQTAVTVTGTPEVEVLGVTIRDVPALASLGSPAQAEAGRRWGIAVTAATDAPPGQYRGAVVLDVVVAGQATPMEVPVVLDVRPNVVVRPAALVFALVGQGTPAPWKGIRALTRSGETFHVLEATTSDPRIQVRQGTALNQYEVSVSTEGAGIFEGEVLLSTDLPLEKTVHVPVYAHVVPR